MAAGNDVVEQIRQFINANPALIDQEEAPPALTAEDARRLQEMAEQFAEQCRLTNERAYECQGLLKGVEVLGVEDHRQDGPVDGAVLFHGLACDVLRIGDLLGQNDAIVGHGNLSDRPDSEGGIRREQTFPTYLSGKV